MTRPYKLVTISKVEDLPMPKVGLDEFIFRYLSDNGKKTQKQIIKAFHLRHSSVYGALQKLIEQNKIERIICPTCDHTQLYKSKYECKDPRKESKKRIRIYKRKRKQ